jgi:hypothetical protein
MGSSSDRRAAAVAGLRPTARPFRQGRLEAGSSSHRVDRPASSLADDVCLRGISKVRMDALLVLSAGRIRGMVEAARSKSGSLVMRCNMGWFLCVCCVTFVRGTLV